MGSQRTAELSWAGLDVRQAARTRWLSRWRWLSCALTDKPWSWRGVKRSSWSHWDDDTRRNVWTSCVSSAPPSTNSCYCTSDNEHTLNAAPPETSSLIRIGLFHRLLAPIPPPHPQQNIIISSVFYQFIF